MANFPQKRAAGLIIFRKVEKEIEYLLMQTSYGEHHWSPPKGHNDKGETDFEAALRETEEESGYKASDLKIYHDFKKVLNYEVRGKPKIVTYWLAELACEKKVQLSREHQDYKWVTLQEAFKIAPYKDFQEALKECQTFLTQNN